MFARFRGFRNRIKKAAAFKEQEMTLENSGLTPEQQGTAKNALKILGMDASDKKESLTKQDFIVFLYAMGLNPTDDIIDSKIRAFKLHNKRELTIGQLAHVWYSMLQDLTDEEEILKRAFQFFDKDGNGEISVQELKTTMHELGDLLSEEEIHAFMAIMDVNNDGVIGYNEFLDTLKTQTPELSGSNHKLKTGVDETSAHAGLARAGAGRRDVQDAPPPSSSSRPAAPEQPAAEEAPTSTSNGPAGEPVAVAIGGARAPSPAGPTAAPTAGGRAPSPASALRMPSALDAGEADADGQGGLGGLHPVAGRAQ